MEPTKTGPLPEKAATAIFVIWQVFGDPLGSQCFILHLFFNAQRSFFSQILTA